MDERIRLPIGRTIAQIHKKQEVVRDDNDNIDSIGTDGDDELIDQLDGLNFKYNTHQVRWEENKMWEIECKNGKWRERLNVERWPWRWSK